MNAERRTLKIISFLCFFLVQHVPLSAQESQAYRPEQKWIQLAEEQYNNGHFTLAIQSAKHSLETVKTKVDSARSHYYLTISKLKTDAADAEESALDFLSVTSNKPYEQRVSLALAQYYFRKGMAAKAIPYYEKASFENLSNEEIADAKFERAYGYFISRRFEEAFPLFKAVKEIEGKHFAAGNYYYALLAYNIGDYDQALISFQRIENEKEYRNIVPYYVAEIYYFKGDRKKALETATALLRREEKLYYDKELYLLAAQVLFEEERYGEALPFFENYYDRTDTIRKEELYEMAYSYYTVQEWKNAISKFRQLSNTEDSLGQTAMYLLGDSYLKTNDKKSARSAFGIAAEMPFNKGQQEAALLLHGKLSYDLGFDDDATASLTELIIEYPASPAISEAKTLLSELLLKTKNYSGAFDLLQQVTNRDKEYWRVFQKVSYSLGVQKLQDGNLAEADSFLTLAVNKGGDELYASTANFWKGEIAMRQKKPQQAISYLQRFVQFAEGKRDDDFAGSTASLGGAWLNLGYASMELQRYEDAKNYFSKIKSSNTKRAVVNENAQVREADALFMLKDYKAALAQYENVIASGSEDAGYAGVQKAILLGVLGRKAEKISVLQSLLKNTTESPRTLFQARYELGLQWIEDDKYAAAIQTLEPLTTEAASGFAQKAWMRIGFAWQQLNDDTKAINAYRHAVADFPASEERTAALEALKSLYIERNEPQVYARFLEEQQVQDVGTASLDSTFYEAASAQFAAGRWAAAKQSFNQYLEKYPNGTAMVQAHYYKGEAHYQLKEFADAAKEYLQVLEQPWNEFSENSAKRGAAISEKPNQHQEAIKFYNYLRNNAISRDNLEAAYSGLLRSAYASEQFGLAERYADTLMTVPDVDSQSLKEVQFYKARSLQRQDKKEEALAAFNAIEEMRNGDLAAEKGYRIAELEYELGRLKEAEASAAANLKTAAGKEYWVVKSYLLIADVLVAQKDYFNAKATLKSVISNTKNATLKSEAESKLMLVKKKEKEQSKLIEE